jgi:flagellin
MSGIVLSASVRQNLLSLQSTAALLATTQNDLATGNKVNTALDNPTNFFTAQGLNNRASDISSLLDSIGNGVQVLQAANTGLTSLESLVQSAQSVATQALQTTVGYSSKSDFTVALGSGATAANLLGGSTFTNSTLTGLAVDNTAATPAAVTAATSLTAAANTNAISATIANGDTLTVDGHLITFATGAPPTTATVAPDSGVVASNTNVTTDGAGDSTIYLNGGAASIGDLLEAVDLATGGKTAAISGGAATVTTTTGDTPSSVNGSGQLLVQTGTTSDLTISSSNTSLLASLGIGNGSATTSLARTPASGSSLQTGTVLDIAAVGNGTATHIVFGNGTGQISNLNDLNTALAANNLQATLDADGNLTIVTDNDNASATIGALTGSTNIFAGRTSSAPVADPAAQATRAGLISQYNNILSQITTTAQDSSFNGINLLNGDTLKLVFNETGTSTLSINGANFNAAGLGLSNLVVGTDFIDNAATNKVLTSLQGASDILRSEASNLGSNLSVVQIRQDFNKNLINVLQTGASNLTLADPNEEAANSQALSTRQSIAVSALALANQSQQSVLQLLR